MQNLVLKEKGEKQARKLKQQLVMNLKLSILKITST